MLQTRRVVCQELRREAETVMKIREPALIEHFAEPRARWGRLQSRCWNALCDSGEATGEQISAVCWDVPPTPLQVHSQGRAAKSIGARPVRRVGRQWIWRLELSKE